MLNHLNLRKNSNGLILLFLQAFFTFLAMFLVVSHCTHNNCQFLCLPSSSQDKIFSCVCPTDHEGINENNTNCITGKRFLFTEHEKLFVGKMKRTNDAIWHCNLFAYASFSIEINHSVNLSTIFY